MPEKTQKKQRSLSTPIRVIGQWLDSDFRREELISPESLPDQMNWERTLPFIFLHLGCLAVFLVGFSWISAASAIFLYLLRMFAITGFYHRYFSHRSFKTSRVVQFFFALLGNSSMQRGPLWWAATHRHHHKHSDEKIDAHSPIHHGFTWSHIGWLTSMKNFPTDYQVIPDLKKFPELVFLNRFDQIVPFVYGLLMISIGAALEIFAPSLNVTMWQFFIWTFFISTTALLHGTLFINSLAHVWGKRRYETKDDSRNSFLLSLITLGEGWHNNHHRWPQSVRQGFRWYEVDMTWYGLWLLARLGIIWDMNPIPEHIQEETRQLDSMRRKHS